MVSAPEADTRDGRHTAMSSDFPSKLPSAKQLIAAATSPGDRDLSDAAIVRRSEPGPSPTSQLEAREPPPPPASYRRDHVVPINSPPVNGHHHSISNGMHRPHGLPPGSSQSQADAEAMQRAQSYSDYSRQIDAQTREINNLGELLMRIEHKVQSLDRDMHLVRQELHHRGQAPQAGNVDDGTLEIFSRNLSQVANKANEVDGIAVELALLRRKVARLEEQSQLASPTAINGQFPHRDAPLHALPAPAGHQQHALPTIPSISTLASPHHPPERRVVQTPGGPLVVEYPDPRAGDHRGSGHSIASAHGHDVETPSSAVGGGWTSVNQGAKRPSDANGRVDISGTPLGSPKRPKLAPLEPRLPSNESVPHAGPYDEHRDLPHLRPHSTESYTDSAQAHPHHPGYPPMQDAVNEENWRHESQRSYPGGHSAGGSPKRGGRGGRGRGGRRSGHEQDLMTTPEWEREQWAAGTQAGPDGYYQPLTPSGRGRGVLRRGSGGGPLPPSQQHLAAQTVMMQPGDPYAHTKKQRQKPTRNAEGILIRKDGRPDMRSQSSAANLRKVHARKEEERQREWEAAQTAHSPTSAKGGFTAMNTDERESRSVSSESQDVAEAQLQGDKTEEQSRHEQVMKQMFPRGVEESRSRAIYGFGDDKDRLGPASLSRDDSKDSMLADETQPSTAAVSNVPTPEPPIEPAGASVMAENNNEKVDAQMEDAGPITAALPVQVAAAAAAPGAPPAATEPAAGVEEE